METITGTDLPRSAHFVGIGGIGMSGLAQAMASLGCRVTGSDRALANPENKRIFDSLRALGIGLFPQDGSVYDSETPEAIVYSTAIEEDNPDFACAPEGLTRLHRSAALERTARAMHGKKLRAVAGSSGKTTVTAWLTEALYNLQSSPGSLCGGLMNRFVTDTYCGNFLDGTGGDFVIEADESDKSLLNYTPDSAIILNIGTDHYSREELANVFRKFILSLKSHAIVEDHAFAEIGPETLSGQKIVLFSADFSAPAERNGRKVRKLDSYEVTQEGAFCSFDGQRRIRLPAPGIHNASNALAVYCELLELGYQAEEAVSAVEKFSGVWRRFDYAGSFRGEIRVYDDYAHNVEKVTSVVKAAQSLTPAGRVFAVFQPHGFAPLRFIREELFESLKTALRKQDFFGLLPVYYAGGTASFSPTSEEVMSGYRQKAADPEQWLYFADRDAVEKKIKKDGKKGDIVLILGARDNSLSTWAKIFAQKT